MERRPQALEHPDGVVVHGPLEDRFGEVLTPGALDLLAALHRGLDARRLELLEARRARQKGWDEGALPGFLPETENIRLDPDWRVGAIPEGLLDRRVEITGPVERKMMINAFNSGARVFMADFEDSNSPTWGNNVRGQLNLLDHARGKLEHRDEKKGKEYQVGEDPARLVVRVRGLHLPEVHVTVDGQPVAGALFDFALHFHHNAKALRGIGLGPWFYVPKLEHHEEAAWWDAVFSFAEKEAGLERGTIKATCLIETFPAVFQMHEILHALRDHIVGLNAGRWDYIFSCIKTTRYDRGRVLPDRAQVSMTVPFMRAYSELLVKTCHERGAFAMGGMSAFIPNRRDPEVTKNALEQVRADKRREVGDGCDGTWVAHPDLVPVALEDVDRGLGGRVNQLERRRDDLEVDEGRLRDFSVPGGRITRAGLRGNLDVGIRYLEAWLTGTGAAAIHNLMEDAATAEISRSQVWQWLHHGVALDDQDEDEGKGEDDAGGAVVTRKLVETMIQELVDELTNERGGTSHRFQEAAALFRKVALSDDFPEFLTVPAYPLLTEATPP